MRWSPAKPLIVDDSIDEASADVTAYLKSGDPIHIRVEHAIGSLENPMTDSLLEKKFHDLSDPVIGQAQTNELIKSCWSLAQSPNLHPLLKQCLPS